MESGKIYVDKNEGFANIRIDFERVEGLF